MSLESTCQAGSRPAQAPSMAARRREPCRCAVCHAPLPLAAGTGVDAYPTCHAIACRMVVSRRAGMGEAGFRHYLQVQAGQRQRQAALAAASAARRQAEADENAAAWSALRACLALTAAHAPLQLLLPCGPRHGRRVSFGRRERYREHLLRLSTEACGLPAAQPRATEPAAQLAPSSLPDRLCALCRGGCCTRGGEHAYLTALTLRRFMDAQPQLSPAQVVAAYLDRVAPRTQSGSCINHTPQGCSLPREMRSDTCNRFACESLAQLQAAQRGEQPVQVVLVVRRKQDQWRRAEPGLDNAVNGAAVLRETGVRRMPAASLRAPAEGA